MSYNNLHKPEVFFNRYEFHRKTSYSYTEAYNKTEREHEKKYGERKYSNFRSFNAAYNRART